MHRQYVPGSLSTNEREPGDEARVIPQGGGYKTGSV